ncbi:PIK1 [Sanghuangporus weigelae]
MSHALLLRLFLSPSFFSVNVALQYLMQYHDNIGITYYLTRRLREFDINELRDVWGFVCHLLVTRPSKSRALESIVVETCERSTHMAMFTLWFMQAHLRDLATRSKDSKSFLICQRILHRCHEIIFEDSPGLVAGPYSSMKVRSRKSMRRNRIKHHLQPAIIGMSCVLAGAPGLPTLTKTVGPVALEQGRVDDTEGNLRSVEPQDNEASVPSPSHNPVDQADADANEDEEEEKDDQEQTAVGAQAMEDNEQVSLSNSEGRKGDLRFKALTQSQRLRLAVQTTPTLSILKDGLHHSIDIEDPFGQLDTPSSNALPYQSTPAVSTSKKSSQSGSADFVETLLQEYDNETQRHLLQSHYCHSEIQLILTLENISNRLLVVPKPARVSALRAELTTLNHKLPAEVCLPMWCSGYESPFEENRGSKPHHRIVRIPPDESVVLNSADRAPYLLILEVLHGDLDFDPSKRGNKDLVKSLLRKELKATKLPRGGNGLSESSDIRSEPPMARTSGAEEALNPGEDGEDAELSSRNLSRSLLSVTSESNGEEEVDLVEQVYGEDLSVHRTPDLAESLVVPLPPKNRALDIATWSRSNSLPSSPAMTPKASMAEVLGNNSHRQQSHATASSQSSTGSGRIPTLSLDEYSERMRTAAVMLAQLNATLVKETYIPTPRSEHPPSAADTTAAGSSWFPMSNWLSGVNTSNTTGPLHPSLSGTSDSKNAHVTTTRMRLQPSEVAAIRERIMQEMLALEEERMGRMQFQPESETMISLGAGHSNLKTAEDEQIIRRELNRVDPSAVVFSESWALKKSRIRQSSPYGHLASWDCLSVIVKAGTDLRQEQLAVQMIRELDSLWKEENCQCWVRPFQIFITGASSGLVETITDAVSVHSIKKSLYARRLTDGRLGQASLLDHFTNSYGDPSSAKFARAQRNFVRSLAGYSIVTYLLQIKDRHNGNILLDRDGHLIHIDFGFMLSNSPGNIGFEAAPFKLTFDYVEVMGGVDSPAFREFHRLFHEGFQAARKHCDRIITIVELMQKDSTLPCFAALGEQTANQLRERFQPKSNQQSATELAERLIMSSLGSNWTRLYDSFQYYSQSIL